MDEKVMEIIGKAMQDAIAYNRSNRTDVFISYAGHINGIHMYFAIGGWKEGVPFTEMEPIYLDGATEEDVKIFFQPLYNLIKESK